MRLFELRGSYTKGDLISTFHGYFVLRRGEEIEGYVEETQGISFIKGVFDEGNNKLAFVKMSNNSLSHPLAYVFSDLEKEGVWSSCTMRRGFFHHDTISGNANVKISVFEASESRQKRLIEHTVETYDSHAASATAHNKDLINEVCCLREFF